jgi:hypothetical protein
MSKKYTTVVIHYSANQMQNTAHCRYVTESSYIEDNQDVVWFNNTQYVEIFKNKRSLDHNNKLLAIIRLKYKDRVIRRRYRYDHTLHLTNEQVGLTSESVRILFDDLNASKELVTVSKGNIWDVFMYYWSHPFHATRISFKVGILSIILGSVSLIIALLPLVC